jgi:hypothetical protein
MAIIRDNATQSNTLKVNSDGSVNVISDSGPVVGQQSDASYTGTGNSTLVGLLKGIYSAIKGTLAIRALTSGTDSVTVVPGSAGFVIGVIASDGYVLTPDSLAKTYVYNSDNSIQYVQVQAPNSFNYRVTYSYTAGNLTSSTNWVKQ